MLLIVASALSGMKVPQSTVLISTVSIVLKRLPSYGKIRLHQPPKYPLPMQSSPSPHGVLLLDKPCGISSNRALQIVRRLLGKPKAGHSGSLDPLASGLLPIFIGKGTRCSQLLLAANKTYIADIKLGITTDTYDQEGTVVANHPVPTLTETALKAALDSFVGDIMQVPPAFSALKMQGKPLYAYARRGIEFTPLPKAKHIADITLLNFSGDTLQCKVTCSSGTYIRSLAHDLGQSLGCGAALWGLRRIGVGELVPTITLPAFEALSEAERWATVTPLSTIFHYLPTWELQPPEFQRLIQGQFCEVPPLTGWVNVKYQGDWQGLLSVKAGQIKARIFANSA